MQNKEVSNVRIITGELIGGFILYTIPLGILYSFVYELISKIISEESLILKAIIVIVLQAIIVWLIWKCSISTTFRKRLINENDVPIVIKNLIIFSVILFIISVYINFNEINEKIDKEINSNIGLQLSESYMKYLYTDEQIAEYRTEKEKSIKEVKNKVYTYLGVLEIGLMVVYVGIVPLQKQNILKYME